jgi:hypothetical protein
MPDFSYPFSGLSIGIGGVNATGDINTYTEENVDATAGNITRTLPSVSGRQGYRYKIQKVDASANTVTVAAAGADHILTSSGLVTSVTLYTQGEYIWVTSDGVDTWYEG